MKKLNLYIGRSLLGTTLAGLAVLTFVMVSGSLIEVFDLLSRGVSGWLLVQFVGYRLPAALGFTMPLALLAAVVIVFSRLSADREIVAMQASGVGLWQIVAPGLLLAVLFSVVCFVLQASVIPAGGLRAEMLRSSGGVVNPLVFLEPGRPVQLPGYVVYVGRRDGETLEDIQLYVLDKQDRIAQDIHALRGWADYDAASQALQLTLEQALFGIVDHASQAGEADGIQRTRAERVVIPINLVDAFRSQLLTRKVRHQSLRGLMSLIHIYSQNGLPTLNLYLQLHKRLVMSLAPIGFLLIGMPFGIRTRRSETVAGAVVSLGLALVFYVFVALATSLDSRPGWHPEIIIWLPNILYQAGGFLALRRLAAR